MSQEVKQLAQFTVIETNDQVKILAMVPEETTPLQRNMLVESITKTLSQILEAGAAIATGQMRVKTPLDPRLPEVSEEVYEAARGSSNMIEPAKAEVEEAPEEPQADPTPEPQKSRARLIREQRKERYYVPFQINHEADNDFPINQIDDI